jgi:AcrR family transcriptional regulator
MIHWNLLIQPDFLVDETAASAQFASIRSLEEQLGPIVPLPFNTMAEDMDGRESRGAETRERIVRAALTLFVARGIAATTTREIAMAAGIAEGTIYRHFTSKDELALQSFVEQHVSLARALEAAHRPHERLREKSAAIVACYCRAADADWLAFSYHLLAMHTLLRMVPDGQPEPADVIRSVIREAMVRGEIPERDVEIMTASTLGIVIQPAFHKIYGAVEGPLSAHLPLFTDAVWRVLTV